MADSTERRLLSLAFTPSGQPRMVSDVREEVVSLFSMIHFFQLCFNIHLLFSN